MYIISSMFVASFKEKSIFNDLKICNKIDNTNFWMVKKLLRTEKVLIKPQK